MQREDDLDERSHGERLFGKSEARAGMQVLPRREIAAIVDTGVTKYGRGVAAVFRRHISSADPQAETRREPGGDGKRQSQRATADGEDDDRDRREIAER